MVMTVVLFRKIPRVYIIPSFYLDEFTLFSRPSTGGLLTVPTFSGLPMLPGARTYHYQPASHRSASHYKFSALTNPRRLIPPRSRLQHRRPTDVAFASPGGVVDGVLCRDPPGDDALSYDSERWLRDGPWWKAKTLTGRAARVIGPPLRIGPLQSARTRQPAVPLPTNVTAVLVKMR